MRKNLILIIAVLAVLAAAVCLAACGSDTAKGGAADTADPSEDDSSGSIQIVATIFPEYDWTMNVLGENPADAEVTLLLGSGVDLHSYQPSAEDILKISTCDLFIYVGGESDAWVAEALQEAVNEDMVVIDLLDVLGDSAREEEEIPGLEEQGGHDGEASQDGEADSSEAEEEEGPEYDEHVWLSLRNACLFTEALSQAMQTLDEDNADTYRSNAEAYLGKLEELDEKYEKTVSAAETKTLLFGDRFPFRYLVDDYGLDYYAAFAGCSAETEASFETITFLAGKVDELSLPAVMTIDGTDGSIAETIVQNTKKADQKILTLDSMQSTTSEEIEGGVTYLSVMEKNLSVLKEALQ